MSEARDRLMQCLHDVIVEEGGLEEGEMVGDWITVVHLVGALESPRNAYYMIAPMSEGIPAHVARGLLHEGLMMWSGATHDDD